MLRDSGRLVAVEAVQKNLTAFHVFLSQWPAISLHRDNDRIWTLSERRFSLCNVVLEARFEGDVDTSINRALAPFLGSNVNVMWKLGPSTTPSDLGDRLLNRGFLARPALRGMVLNLASLERGRVDSPSGFEVREVTDARTLDLWRQAVSSGFGWPQYGAQDVADNLDYFFRAPSARPFVAYIGLVRARSVASSLVFFGAGVAGIYHVSTAPDHRGRGLGSAITRAPLVEAARRGYHLAVLHATEMGYPIYRRLGFKELCTVELRLRLSEPQ